MNAQKLSRKESTVARSEAILKSAMEVFSEYGFYEADVDEIAHRAKVGKGTVYNHFGNKQKLFLSVVEWGIESLEEKIKASIENLESFQEKIHIGLLIYFEFFETRKNFFRVLVREKSNFREEMEKKFTEKYSIRLHFLENDIKRGIELNELKRVNPHQCAVIFMGMCNALIYDNFFMEMDGKLADRIAIVEELFFNGLMKQ